MMQYRFMVDKDKAITAGVVCLLCATMTGVMMYLGRPISLTVFAAVMLLFGWLTAQNGAIIVMDNVGISKTLLGMTLHHMDWADIAEIGVCGTNPLNKGKPEKSGRLYIYYSSQKLDDKARYAMILKWPPKAREQLYFIYEPRRLNALRLLWEGEVEEYNVGSLRL